MNIATSTMEKTTQMLRSMDKKLKAMGQIPYGVRKATLKEQRQMYANLTEGQLYELIQKHGKGKVNEWLYKMERDNA